VGNFLYVGEIEVGALAGSVALDFGGEPVEGATVELRKLGEEVLITTTTTDSKGHFELGTNPYGDYQIDICKDGLNPARFARQRRSLACSSSCPEASS
jgi:hypothetical protein